MFKMIFIEFTEKGKITRIEAILGETEEKGEVIVLDKKTKTIKELIQQVLKLGRK